MLHGFQVMTARRRSTCQWSAACPQSTLTAWLWESSATGMTRPTFWPSSLSTASTIPVRWMIWSWFDQMTSTWPTRFCPHWMSDWAQHWSTFSSLKGGTFLPQSNVSVLVYVCCVCMSLRVLGGGGGGDVAWMNVSVASDFCSCVLFFPFVLFVTWIELFNGYYGRGGVHKEQFPF